MDWYRVQVKPNRIEFNSWFCQTALYWHARKRKTASLHGYHIRIQDLTLRFFPVSSWENCPTEWAPGNENICPTQVLLYWIQSNTFRTFYSCLCELICYCCWPSWDRIRYRSDFIFNQSRRYWDCVQKKPCEIINSLKMVYLQYIKHMRCLLSHQRNFKI